ncbi:hypothetical protein [Paraburkholderia tuberum]|uniref:Uncharacterized protein n=1 Tax=Paraburkholderia tuberum TaxID=157910 RepID=A0A1H1GUR7_9BURK|nr:hypothetical protein [Paraburkholderia tuberum]SDR16803.1 hypothetical protein SAMN05445850_3092 [Paraburkholderia tuberum]
MLIKQLHVGPHGWVRAQSDDTANEPVAELYGKYIELAPLFATAPDLLDALEHLVEVWDAMGLPMGYARRRAEIAIDKAKGA